MVSLLFSSFYRLYKRHKVMIVLCESIYARNDQREVNLASVFASYAVKSRIARVYLDSYEYFWISLALVFTRMTRFARIRDTTTTIIAKCTYYFTTL